MNTEKNIFDFNIDPDDNFLLDVDSYKVSHGPQYPPGIKKVFSYIESRGGKYKDTLFFGLQIYLKKYLSKPITQEMIDQAALYFEQHGEPFNKNAWEYILKKYNGRLPVEIKAVAEGTIVPFKNALVTIENTDEKVPWLPSWVETSLHRAIWYPVTVASNSLYSKRIIQRFMKETASEASMGGIDFMLHDFGARGVSSKESAGIGGAAHLVNFKGTDNNTGVLYAMKYYNTREMVAFSIPAAEHSSITTWGQDREVDAYRNMLTQFGGKYPMIAVVSDSYDIYDAVENIWGEELREEVINCGSTIVIRPDSGIPCEVVLKIVKILAKKFGTTKNEKGFLVLNHVRVIQGDGITSESINEIFVAVVNAGYSAENLAFGQGGGLLQQLDRDTNQFAMKASAALIDGVWIDVYKDPITDNGKKSKKGRLMLYRNRNTDILSTKVESNEYGLEYEPLLHTVFINGNIVKEFTFAEIRQNTQK